MKSIINNQKDEINKQTEKYQIQYFNGRTYIKELETETTSLKDEIDKLTEE